MAEVLNLSLADAYSLVCLSSDEGYVGLPSTADDDALHASLVDQFIRLQEANRPADNVCPSSIL